MSLINKYSKKQLGIDLLHLLEEGSSSEKISDWAHSLHSELQHDAFHLVADELMTLATMNVGPEFELTKEELHQMADRLIRSDL